jgi:hypothetical protein
LDWSTRTVTEPVKASLVRMVTTVDPGAGSTAVCVSEGTPGAAVATLYSMEAMGACSGGAK